MAQAEWDLFGSDSEEDKNDGYSSTSSSYKVKANVGMDDSLEKAIDATILHTPQVLLKSNPGVSLTSRVSGIVVANGIEEQGSASQTLLFRDLLSKKVSQRGMKS